VYVPAGSVATSVFDSDAVLVGASGGVYALIAAHLPSVFLVSSFVCGPALFTHYDTPHR